MVSKKGPLKLTSKKYLNIIEDIIFGCELKCRRVI